jgi:hypothetical protein
LEYLEVSTEYNNCGLHHVLLQLVPYFSLHPSRQFDDGISNAMDRWYGPCGLRPDEPENAVYIFEGAPGLEILKEIAPTAEERADGWMYMGKHLDMFWYDKSVI